MENVLNSIKEILDNNAKIVTKELTTKTENNNLEISDDRFELLEQQVNSFEQKDDIFYTELIRFLAPYIDELYDRNVLKNISKANDLVINDFDLQIFDNKFKLEQQNRKLSTKLFEYVCDILNDNKNIKLDIGILKRLLNRNPKLFSLVAEEEYLYRPFDFNRLINIIVDNQTLEKSNISTDDIYQLLIDTCQLNNDEVFSHLVKPEEFKTNHKKIDELLMDCNAKTFAEITNIITKHLDKNFDRLTILKKRNKNNFCERVIVALSRTYTSKDDLIFIHQILTDKEITINYNYDWTDYYGGTTVKEILALSSDSTIIKELLSKEENIENYYRYGCSIVPLYELYAIIGEYEKSLNLFQENYGGEDDELDEIGYTYASFPYEDFLVNYIKKLCASFSDNNIEYSNIREIIYKILVSKNVKYINLQEILPIIKKVLSDEDFNLLLDTLLNNYNSGNIKFITINENYNADIDDFYIIKIVNDEQLQNYLDSLNEDVKKKTLN